MSTEGFEGRATVLWSRRGTSCRENYDQERVEWKEKEIVKLKAEAKLGKITAAYKTRG